uniref:ZU5 domain-containing protein n=2 Tax=gambiae species complex TaxID=44542 RepID=A0A8W7PCN0_ANOCL
LNKDGSAGVYNQQKLAGVILQHHYHQYHSLEQSHLQRQIASSPIAQSQKGQYRSSESLSGTSNTNTSISTYAIATTDSLDTSSSSEAMYKSNSVRQVVTSDGGWLEMEHLQTSLSIPEGAIPAALRINVFLAVMYDSKDTILVENQVTHISPTIVCGPAKSNFTKPLIIKVPHCAEDIGSWKVSLFYKEEVTNCWKKIASSENDVPSPQAYIQLDQHNAYIMTRKLGKYLLGGESLTPEVNVTKRLKIVMFGPARKPEADFNIRAYVLEDYPSALEHCSGIETRLGYFQIGQSSPFHFANNKEAMTLRINCSGGWTTAAECAVQKIPFNHIWKNMSILNCEFLLHKLTDEMPCLRLELAVEQDNGAKVLITSVAFS